VQQIKDDIRLNDIPILFITANEKDETIVSAFNYGGVDFIKKPLNLEINNHIGQVES